MTKDSDQTEPQGSECRSSHVLAMILQDTRGHPNLGAVTAVPDVGKPYHRESEDRRRRCSPPCALFLSRREALQRRRRQFHFVYDLWARSIVS
jgi:hypothetical protein